MEQRGNGEEAVEPTRKHYFSPANEGTGLYKLPEVIRLTSLSRSEIYRRVAARTFPVPVRLGPKAIAFASSEVFAWIDARLAERTR